MLTVQLTKIIRHESNKLAGTNINSASEVTLQPYCAEQTCLLLMALGSVKRYGVRSCVHLSVCPTVSK